MHTSTLVALFRPPLMLYISLMRVAFDAGLIGVGLKSGMREATRPFCVSVRLACARLSAVPSSGSEVSRGEFLQDRFIQFCLGQQSFETSIFIFQASLFLWRNYPLAPVFTPPLVVRLVNYPKFLADIIS